MRAQQKQQAYSLTQELQIAQKRQIKEATVWHHLANLIEHHQLRVDKILSKEKAAKISACIKSRDDKLKDIKQRLNDTSITYDEINCVIANIKTRSGKQTIYNLTKWYQRTNCQRKCYFHKQQRNLCSKKFNLFAANNPALELTKREFLDLFNNHINICILPDKEKQKLIT